MLGIELVAVADFPELARRDVDTGLPLEPATHSVDGSLAEALALIAEVWPASVVDVLAMVRSIVPLTAPPGHIYNTSSGQTPSVVQLTIRPDEDAFCLAETIVHEAAHVKLDAVWDLEPLLIDDGTDRHRHPWLPDLRPLLRCSACRCSSTWPSSTGGQRNGASMRRMRRRSTSCTGTRWSMHWRCSTSTPSSRRSDAGVRAVAPGGALIAR